MTQTIQSSSPEEAIRKSLSPLGEIQITGDDRSPAFIAFSNEVMKVFILGRAEGRDGMIRLRVLKGF